MKKSLLLTAALTALLLTGCSTNKPDTAASSKSSTAQTSASSAGKTSSEKAESASRSLYADLLAQYQANGQYGQYAFYDIDQNGTEELLLGQDLNGEPYLGLLAYSKQGKPEILPEAKVASGGGHRSALTIYEDGRILYEQFSSYNGDGEAALYRLKADNSQIEMVKTADFQIGETSAEEALGLTKQPKLDLTKLNWQTFESQAGQSGLDIDAISKSDYSSLSGSWENSQGQRLVFDDLGLVGSGQTLSTDVRIEEGYLRTAIIEADSSSEIIFAPAGISLDSLGTADASDKSRDRIWVGRSLADLSNQAAFYYKIDEN